MLQSRLIPCLQVKDNKLVKTFRFKNEKYIGDVVNAVKIFNDKEVDELIILDISRNRHERGPNFELIRKIADECFMPVCYGGGISSTEQIREILKLGIEKVILNSALQSNRDIIRIAAGQFGSQCIMVSLDIKKNWRRKYKACFQSGRVVDDTDPITLALEFEKLGAGELLVNNIQRDGTWAGFDVEILQRIATQVKIPVIALGGAGTIQHIEEALNTGRASAVAIGSMAVYQNKDSGVLINFPKPEQLKHLNQNY